jgi:hypothetical protein
MSWTLAFSPLIGPAALIGIAVLAVVILLPGLIGRVRGAALRALAGLALIAALANPVLINEDREALPTVVALVVDQSASQNLDGRARITAAARDALSERFADFPGIDLRIVEAGDGGLSDGTKLFGPLAEALSDVPPNRIGAVVMLTDGRVHDIPESAAAAAPAAPLHVLVTGRPDERDRRIVIETAPRFGIINERQVINYRVLEDGGSIGRVLQVIVTLDGEPYSVESVIAGEGAALSVEVTHGGPNVLEFEAELLDGELTEKNNTAIVAIEGIRENLRVLLVSGEPHTGERTWRNLLKSDAAVDLVHFTILRPPSKQDGTPIDQLSLIAFPTRELFSQKIHEFDLIIFDRYHHRGVLPILYFDNIARFVRDGGALLVAAGPDYAGFSSLYQTPLSPVLPVAPTGRVIEAPYYPRVTEAGNRHPVTRALKGADSDPPDWGRFFRLVEGEQPVGDVLMSAIDDKPLLVLNRQESGRVALLLSDHTWLWARGFEGGGPHVDLLRRLAHWLMKETDLEEEALRARISGADLIVERQTMQSWTQAVTVEAPSGSITRFALDEAGPGLWRVTVPAEEIGLYRIEQGDRRAFAHNGPPNPREYIDPRSTTELLSPLVSQTMGRIARVTDRDGALSLPRIVPIRSGLTTAGTDWIGVRMTEASILKGIDRIPLLTGLFGIFGVTGLLGLLLLVGLPFATWLREGR